MILLKSRVYIFKVIIYKKFKTAFTSSGVIFLGIL